MQLLIMNQQISMFFLIFVFVSLMGQISATEHYILYLTHQQIQAMGSAYILDYSNKACINRQTSPKDSCAKYCRLYYAYVPSLPYKNAQQYNPITGQCMPKKFCPKVYGISFKYEINECYDVFTESIVPPVDAEPIKSTNLIKATFWCMHGRVTIFNGVYDCECDLGWRTVLKSNMFSSSKQYQKCNTPASISLYFSNTLKVFYDPNADNLFPHANDPDYWPQLLAYYLRNVKYTIITFFQPYEAQMVSFVLPQQDLISARDLIWMTWVVIVLILVTILSCYQKLVHGFRARPTQSFDI